MGYFVAILVIIILLFAPKKKKHHKVINIPKPENITEEPLFPPDIFEQKEDDETEVFSSDNYTYEQPFVDMQNENLEEISAKNAPYFSYDDAIVEEEEMGKKVEEIAAEKVENNLQSFENEEERNSVDLKNPDELKKAFIYKEILQNPYI